jgi:DNA topoisomerase-1
MLAFGRALPSLRARVAQDLTLPGLPCTKMLATVVRLLETTLIRVGNEEYALANASFGLTTLRNWHVSVEGESVQFTFRGKSGVRHRIRVTDRRLARIVRRCQDLPGQELFQYLDGDGRPQEIDSADMNGYLHEIAGRESTANDFRAWAGAVLVANALQAFEAFDSQTQAKRNVVEAIKSVARRLGDTQAVCRKCYVHLGIIAAYLDGSLRDALRQRVEQELSTSLAELPPEEAAVLAFLQARLEPSAGP